MRNATTIFAFFPVDQNGTGYGEECAAASEAVNDGQARRSCGLVDGLAIGNRSGSATNDTSVRIRP